MSGVKFPLVVIIIEIDLAVVVDEVCNKSTRLRRPHL